MNAVLALGFIGAGTNNARCVPGSQPGLSCGAVMSLSVSPVGVLGLAADPPGALHCPSFHCSSCLQAGGHPAQPQLLFQTKCRVKWLPFLPLLQAGGHPAQPQLLLLQGAHAALPGPHRAGKKCAWGLWAVGVL